LAGGFDAAVRACPTPFEISKDPATGWGKMDPRDHVVRVTFWVRETADHGVHWAVVCECGCGTQGRDTRGRVPPLVKCSRCGRILLPENDVGTSSSSQ
jgi:hypothetical protein